MIDYIDFLRTVQKRPNEEYGEVIIDGIRPHKYFISNYGDRVYSLCRNKPRLLSINKRKGYYYSTFQVGKKRQKVEIHILVARAFVKNEYEDQENIVVHHLDYNIKNNRFDNLTYLPKEEHDKLHKKDERNEK